jgi:hypothetical protein
MGERNGLRQLLQIATIAVATLLFESTLTRLLAVAQFYHFAFLVVSLALLGFGASGTLLSIIPKTKQISPERMLGWSGAGFAIAVALAYIAINTLPFDSYSIAWERRQILFFLLYYLALTVPFLVSGLGIGAGLAFSPAGSHRIYAANLAGSALGALLAPLVLSVAGVPGAVLFSAAIGLIAAQPFLMGKLDERKKGWQWLASGVLGLGLLIFGGLVAVNQGLPVPLGDTFPLGMHISPYKGLSYARQYPGSQHVYGAWNAVSRLDVIANAGTRRLPGLSYQYPGQPPLQLGLSIDGDTLQPITLSTAQDFDAAAWLPEALAYQLRPRANVLVIEAGGGLGVLQALAGGADAVTALSDNRLIPDAVSQAAPDFDVYTHPDVSLVHEAGRTFLRRPGQAYDLLIFPLTDAYRPVTSGAYSLGESYLLTVDAFEDALERLSPGGILMVTRWLQSPPSESIRLITTLTEAVESSVRESATGALLAYRSIQTMTVLVNPDGWSVADLETARQFIESRRYDWVWAPGLGEGQANRFNRLPAPEYYRLIHELLAAPDRSTFYAAYPYQIEPVRDDRPFFFHFFTPGQTSEVLDAIGHTWQPFGGSGYLILFALLGLVLLLSALLILLPLAWKQETHGDFKGQPKGRWRILLYFSFLGIAFLFVEIPLIQRTILILEQPIYAFAVVVAGLLTASGAGSMLARQAWVKDRLVFGLLAAVVMVVIFALDGFVAWISPWPMFGRVLAVMLSLLPLGFLMGIPFPRGLSWLEAHYPEMKAWAWAINGCASVIASVLAAILVLSYGFSLAMILGAAAYLGAGMIMINCE